tara:strand:+ start:4529 stop:4708 length:180 start_codon:yes stop_codon:yes gene_type:complete
MDKKLIKKTFETLLQYGWMWGYPKHIDKEGWNNLKEFYKTELNDGKDFEPDVNNKAKAR